MGILRIAFFFLRGLLLSRSTLAVENLSLRQQVAVYICPWIATRRHHAASNRRPRAKSSPSRKSAVYTTGTRGVPRDRCAQFSV